MICRKCGDKWAQEAGYCRTCSRLLGVLPPEPVGIQRRSVPRPEAPLTAASPVSPLQKTLYTVSIDGIEYDVKFDGRQSITSF